MARRTPIIDLTNHGDGFPRPSAIRKSPSQRISIATVDARVDAASKEASPPRMTVLDVPDNAEHVSAATGET